MRYLYYDLGEQQAEHHVVAHLRGSAANVILLDPLNFDRYRTAQPFLYSGGGFCIRTPASLRIPGDGHWYLVIDCGGYTHHVQVKKIEILRPDESPTASEPDRTLVGAHA
jgi:hypothetical protein